MTMLLNLPARILCLSVALGLMLSAATPSAAEPVSLKGSDTLGDEMVPQLVKAYQQTGNTTQFKIEAEGSSSAFKALANGTAAIGMSSRPIKDSEKASLEAAGMKVNEITAGIDMIAVIVNENNDANNLPLDGVKMIFTGKATSWKRLDGEPSVKAFTRDETSGTYKVFQDVALDGEAYGAATIKTSGNGEIAENVASNLGGVGYVGLSYAEAKGVKAVPIEGVTPDPANADTYPLSRKLYYYTIEGKVSPEAQAFIDWATTSPEAAKIIASVGFIAPK